MLGTSLAKKISEKGKDFGPSALSRKTGVHNETILKILSGSTENPGIYTVAKIADALHCSLDELLDRNQFFNIDTKNNNAIEYNAQLLKEVYDFVTTFINSSSKQYNFYDVLHSINEIYLYSKNNNLENIDTKFADWFCKSYLLSRQILHSL